MEFMRLMAGVCAILIPTRVSEGVGNRQMINRMYIKVRLNTEGVKKEPMYQR